MVATILLSRRNSCNCRAPATSLSFHPVTRPENVNYVPVVSKNRVVFISKRVCSSNPPLLTQEMGNILNFNGQCKEIRVIYVQEPCTNRMYPLRWSESFDSFVSQLGGIFPNHRRRSLYYFRDGTVDRRVHVCNDDTFHALVPRHHAVSSDVNSYYCILEGWSSVIVAPSRDTLQ
jgi:hypothetical protein